MMTANMYLVQGHFECPETKQTWQSLPSFLSLMNGLCRLAEQACGTRSTLTTDIADENTTGRRLSMSYAHIETACWPPHVHALR